MGDIILSLKAGPFLGPTADRIKNSSKIDDFLAQRDGHLAADADYPNIVWIEANDDCDDVETYDDLHELLSDLVREGETFSIQQDTFMIGKMGLEEESCGTRIISLKVESGKLQVLSNEWIPQDFS